jgi:hypothetical protein
VQQPESERRLPSFLVIGAVKAATTWISRNLRQSPAVFMPASEPHYFNVEYDRGLDWYLDFFEGAESSQLIGEKTADYLPFAEAARRASELVPHAALIMSLRNPVERAYSDYCMLFRRGSVSARIEDYLDPARAEFRRFIDYGLYHRQISTWLDHFPREHMLILTMEDVTGAPDESLRAIANLIGLKEELVPAAQSKRINDSRELFLPLELRKLLAPLKAAARPLRGKPTFEAIRGTLARPIDYPAMPGELRLRLAEYYREDVERLEKLLDRDLGHWLEAEESAASRKPMICSASEVRA